MPAPKRFVFSRKSVDHVTDELVAALTGGEAFEFKALFLKVFEEMKRKNTMTGGQEMLRLRCYEKLLKLASGGLVEKKGKAFCALKGLGESYTAYQLALANAAVAAAAIRAAAVVEPPLQNPDHTPTGLS